MENLSFSWQIGLFGRKICIFVGALYFSLENWSFRPKMAQNIQYYSHLINYFSVSQAKITSSAIAVNTSLHQPNSNIHRTITLPKPIDFSIFPLPQNNQIKDRVVAFFNSTINEVHAQTSCLPNIPLTNERCSGAKHFNLMDCLIVGNTLCAKSHSLKTYTDLDSENKRNE